MLPFSPARRTFACALFAGACAFGPTAANASNISYVDLFRNISYEQTGNGNALTLNGAFFTAELHTSSATPYNSATVTVPGGAALPLSASGSTDYVYQSSLLPSKAAMNAGYPTGTYQFSGNGSSGTDTATLSYTADDYSQTRPFLAGNTYSKLQGLDASQAFTYMLSSYVPGGTQTDALLFLTVFDATTGAVAFTDGFLSPSTTSITMPANQLAPGKQYSYELDFSDRDNVTGNGGAFTPFVGFDLRTDGTLSTRAVAATPEPGSLMLLGTGLAGVAGCARRRRREPAV